MKFIKVTHKKKSKECKSLAKYIELVLNDYIFELLTGALKPRSFKVKWESYKDKK